jgi:phosphoribosylanthranilate isomerase
MTWIKICGITNLEDALVAVDAGADALGFVFYDKSPRKVDVETTRTIVEKLPAAIEKVGVFVNAFDGKWIDIVQRARLNAIQPVMTTPMTSQGGQVGVDLSSLPQRFKVYVSWPIADFLEDENQVHKLAAEFAHMRKNIPPDFHFPEGIFDTFFLDSGNGQKPGGTGQPFDWRKATPIAEGMRQGGLKLIVAGGLNPGNVAEAIHILKPWGVDVSSGVEARPGKKDPEKVRAFIQAVRNTEKSA